jgi:hypothetical protein
MGSLGFFIAEYFRLQHVPGFDLASNRSEYQGYLLGVKAASA